MRLVRTGLLFAWLFLLVSLFWDPFTPDLTVPGNLASPFHLGPAPMVQGKVLAAEPYPMGARIFWTMILPLIPLSLMLFGHQTWRRVCPLSQMSQIPHMLGWQRQVKGLNRRSGNVERVLALLPTESWLRTNHYYFQFAFLAAGVLGRILFYNADRTALALAFGFILVFALTIGALYGGKTWCNYICPVSVIQDIYTGPGGIFDSKTPPVPGSISQSMCRAPGPKSDRSVCVGCTPNCRDIDLENSYWRSIESNQKRFMYYGFFGLVAAFYSYYYAYSGNWDYYFTGWWTHEHGQLGTLLLPGLYLHGVAIPIPKFVAASLYFALCIAISYWLFVAVELVYERIAAWRGWMLTKVRLRHQMMTVCGFLTFNLFYVFAGRPNILLMPPWTIKLVDAFIILVSTIWLIRALSRDAEIYRREYLARALRDKLLRMGFHSEELLEGRSIDRLSADEVYVLAKSLPNFTLDRKRDVYRAILREWLEAGHTRSAESLEMLRELRAQLGLSDTDHDAIIEALGIRDSALLDPDAVRSVELQVRQENYRKFLVDLVQQGLAAGIAPETYLASAPALKAVRPVRVLFGISDEAHARLAGEITRSKDWLLEGAQSALKLLCQMEAARFSLSFDPRPEALLIRHALLLRQRPLISETANLIASIGERRTACSLAQSLYALSGKEAEAFVEEIKTPIEEVQCAPLHKTSDPVFCSYLDVIGTSKPADEVFVSLTGDREPVIAALAASALASTGHSYATVLISELSGRSEKLTSFVNGILSSARLGGRADAVQIMAELLSVELFATLDLGTLAAIAGRSQLVNFVAGDQVCRLGESSESMFVLVRGETKAWIDSDDQPIVLGRARSGAVFGELGVITGRARSASIEVESPTATVVTIAREVIDELLSRNHEATRRILSVVSGYLADTLSSTGALRVRRPRQLAEAS
jgi:Cyclic nucleotide-binding domain/4Fe-4S binding domain